MTKVPYLDIRDCSQCRLLTQAGKNNFLFVTNLPSPLSKYPYFIFQTPLNVSTHLKTTTLSQVAISTEAVADLKQAIETAFKQQKAESFIQVGEDHYRVKYLAPETTDDKARVEIRSNLPVLSGDWLSRFTLTEEEFEQTKSIIGNIMQTSGVKKETIAQTRKVLATLYKEIQPQELKAFFDLRPIIKNPIQKHKIHNKQTSPKFLAAPALQ